VTRFDDADAGFRSRVSVDPWERWTVFAHDIVREQAKNNSDTIAVPPLATRLATRGDGAVVAVGPMTQPALDAAAAKAWEGPIPITLVVVGNLDRVRHLREQSGYLVGRPYGPGAGSVEAWRGSRIEVVTAKTRTPWEGSLPPDPYPEWWVVALECFPHLWEAAIRG